MSEARPQTIQHDQQTHLTWPTSVTDSEGHSAHNGSQDSAARRRASSTSDWQSDTSCSSSEEESDSKNASKTKGTRKSGKDHNDRFSYANDNIETRGRVSKSDGRLKIKVKQTAEKGYMARVLASGIKHHLGDSDKRDAETAEKVKKQREVDEALARDPDNVETVPRPKLNIVVMVIGSRGDIQPFIKVGRILQNDYGHRVRIATHPAFKKFVEEECELEFFSVGGNPSELMAFMVKNPGLMPSMKTVREGEIGRRRDQMFEMFQGFWRACINATDDESDPQNKRMREWYSFGQRCVLPLISGSSCLKISICRRCNHRKPP